MSYDFPKIPSLSSERMTTIQTSQLAVALEARSHRCYTHPLESSRSCLFYSLGKHFISRRKCMLQKCNYIFTTYIVLSFSLSSNLSRWKFHTSFVCFLVLTHILPCYPKVAEELYFDLPLVVMSLKL